jgi:RNase P subunit RPR2
MVRCPKCDEKLTEGGFRVVEEMPQYVHVELSCEACGELVAWAWIKPRDWAPKNG